MQAGHCWWMPVAEYGRRCSASSARVNLSALESPRMEIVTQNLENTRFVTMLKLLSVSEGWVPTSLSGLLWQLLLQLALLPRVDNWRGGLMRNRKLAWIAFPYHKYFLQADRKQPAHNHDPS